MIFINDENRIVTQKCEEILGKALPPNTQSLGFEIDGKFAGGFCWSHFYDDHSCHVSVVIVDKRVLNRKTLFAFFGYPFFVLKVKRLMAIVDTKNHASNNLVRRMGGHHEGMMRCYYPDGGDANIYSILKSDLETNKLFLSLKK